MLAREVQALREALALVTAPRDEQVPKSETLRPGRNPQPRLQQPTNTDRLEAILRTAGRPMTVNELSDEFSKQTGRPVDDNLKATITSAISKRVHKGIQFVRVSAGVYGLKDRDERRTMNFNVLD